MKKMIAVFAAGAIFGILFAPHKGSKTRKKIAKLKNGLMDSITSLTENAAHEGENLEVTVRHLD